MVAGRSKRAARLAATDVYVNWEVTHQCNLRCRTCHVAAGEGLPQELSGERFSDLLASVLSVREALGESSRLGFTFTGGEPTTNPGLPSFVSRARAEDCVGVISVVTNGLLVDRDLALRLADSGLDWLAISLDGGSARTHDLIRGEGTFRAAIEALRVAVEYTDLYVSTSLTVTGPSLSELEQYVQLVYDIGANQAHVNPFIPTGRGATHAELLVPPARQWELMRLLRALELQYLGRDFLVTYGEPFFGLTDPVEAFGELKYVERKAACGLATKAITLSPSGDVLPCAYMRHLVVGNVGHQSLSQVWSSEAMVQLRDNSLLKGVCQTCAFRDYCRGCRARAWLTSGDLFAEDPLCPLVSAAKGETA